jgi:hypothetical protein
MKTMLFVVALVSIPMLVAPRVASATVCTNNAYGTITCVNQFVLTGSYACGSAQGSLSVTEGNRIVLWVDNTSSVTSITDRAGNSYVKLMPDTTWLGGRYVDSVWTAIASTTTKLMFTPHCTGSVEMAGFQLHSSVGTLGIECASFPSFVETKNGTTVSSSCSAYRGGLAFSITDWDNSQPRAHSGWKLVNDTASAEYSFQLKPVTPGAVTGTWAETSNNDFLSGTVVFNEGNPGSRFSQF